MDLAMRKRFPSMDANPEINVWILGKWTWGQIRQLPPSLRINFSSADDLSGILGNGNGKNYADDLPPPPPDQLVLGEMEIGKNPDNNFCAGNGNMEKNMPMSFQVGFLNSVIFVMMLVTGVAVVKIHAMGGASESSWLALGQAGSGDQPMGASVRNFFFFFLGGGGVPAFGGGFKAFWSGFKAFFGWC